MLRMVRSGVLATLALSVTSCADGGLLSPLEIRDALFSSSSDLPVRISEFHYDNSSTDVGEFVEIAGPAGTDLTGWKVVLYNGSGGAAYDTDALSGVIPGTCGEQGVVTIEYPSNGIQNGSPDGIALVNATNQLVEFISYEGAFTGVGGAAAGVLSVDVGVSQTGVTADNTNSISRQIGGGWAKVARTRDACNDVGAVTPPVPVGPTTVVINELMGDPLAALSASWGEWFEVHNHGSEAVDLSGWEIRSGGQATPHRISRSVVVPAGGYAVLSRSDSVPNNGGVTVDYNYFTTSAATVWLDDNDWLTLRAPNGVTVDSVAWSTLPKGATRALRDASQENRDADGSNWGFSTSWYGGGDFGTPRAPNGVLSDVAPPVPTGIVRVTFTGRNATDPPLPVGFQDQLFGSAFDASGAASTEALVWSSDTPEIATVDQRGVVTARAAGVATIRAVGSSGRGGTFRLATRVAVASATARYEGNAEFGEPADGDASDDFIIRRPQFTSSYNSTRGTPNWVSYNLEATHFGPEDRCDCFTADPLLPQSYSDVSTADYTGAGTFHGYGIDRGHLARSADRTAGSLDNAATYYFSNIIPQAADNNQGPWAILENHLGDQARGGTKEVYVVTGVAGNLGTIKGEGKLVIPATVWKVAVILPRDRGLEDIDDSEDFQLVAVEMPNVAGIRNVPWATYSTTVDAIEARSGYDILAGLPNHIEWLVEAGLGADATAGARLDVLIKAVRELGEKGDLSEGNANALDSMLSAARQQLSSGNEDAVRSQMTAFDNAVRALVRADRLSEENGESLVVFSGLVTRAVR